MVWKKKIIGCIIAVGLAGAVFADKRPAPSLDWPNVARSQLGFSIRDHGVHSPTAITDHETWLGRPYSFHNTYSVNYDYLSWRNNDQTRNKQVVISMRLGWSTGANDRQLPSRWYEVLPARVRARLIEPTKESEVVRRNAFADVVAGRWDDRFESIAKQMVQAGHPDAIIRLGHEFNAHWSKIWSRGLEKEYILAFQHAVGVLRSVSREFVIDWNPSRVTFSDYAIPAYPGDEWVDVIGLDSYCQETSDAFDDTAVFGEHISFAKKHNKPVSYPEWGLWDGDEPKCIEFYYDLFKSLPRKGVTLLYHSYFNMTGGGNHQLNAADDWRGNPLAEARFLELFGGPQPTLEIKSGPLELRSNETRTVVIENGGTGDLSVVAQWKQDDGAYIISGDDTLTIAPGASHELEISKISDDGGENILMLHNTAGYPRQIPVRTAPPKLLEPTQSDSAN